MKKVFLLFSFLLLILASQVAYATAYYIAPKLGTVFPTQVFAG